MPLRTNGILVWFSAPLEFTGDAPNSQSGTVSELPRVSIRLQNG